MMGAFYAVGACVVLAAPAAESFSVSARLDTDSIQVGSEYDIVLTTSVAPALSADGAGFPAPILQLDFPPSVRLTGDAVDSFKELSSNGFLNKPHERLIEESPMRVGLELTRRPSAEDRIFLNVIAYLGGKGGDTFVRRRLELSIEPNAVARSIAGDASTWGTGDRLQIGDEAPDFTLPRADGTKVSLSSYRGKKNVLVTTYRAFW